MGIAHNDLIADSIERFAEVGWHDVKYILGTYTTSLQATLTGGQSRTTLVRASVRGVFLEVSELAIWPLQNQ